MIPDIEIKHYYNKYLEDANNDIIKFQENYDTALNLKINERKRVVENADVIINEVKINLSDYKKEWVLSQYDDKEELLKEVITRLRQYNTGKARIVLLHLVKYCRLLKTCKLLNRAIELANKRSSLKFSDYRKYVAKYYMYGVQKCCIEGYAYHYGYGIGDLSINRWKFHEGAKTNKFVDYRATREAKAKLIAEGKIPYNKKDAEVYKLRGIKYNGVPYVVYKNNKVMYDINISNNKYIARQNLNFDHTEYLSRELRGKPYEEVVKDFLTKEDILRAKCDIRAKLVLYNLFDKTAYLKYIRNVEQCKYKRGAHNSQNRQRF